MLARIPETPSLEGVSGNTCTPGFTQELEQNTRNRCLSAENSPQGLVHTARTCDHTCMSDVGDELRQFCKAFGLKMNTDLGQHFLVDASVLEKILEAAHVEKTDHVVEIGPGVGVLTRELLKHAKQVTAIELDARLIPLLGTFTSRVENPAELEIIEGNALSVPMPTHPYKIVANIPYHITSPLFRHIFLESPVRPTSLTLLMQREVAETISSTEDAGMLTIIVGLFGKARMVTKVPPSSFLPPPKVDSAVLHVDCYSEPKTDAATMEQLFTLTKVGFGQKRKMLSNTIGGLANGKELLSAANIDPTRRPQTLSVDEWITLAKAASSARS